jgi:glycosyltransferase involved in cell wall biosynthesis
MKISILVITYNHEKYIRKALESLLMQRDLTDFEIMLFDDHSTDQTVAIASKVIGNHVRATVHVNEINLGITRNYQQAFSRCAGEYIFVLEGDDYWIDPFKISKQVAFMDLHPYCAMCAHPFIVQHDDTAIFDFPERNAGGFILFDGKDLILDEGIISNFSTCCYKREMMVKISPATYETISYEWMVNISISEFGFLARLHEPMSVYRHSSSGSWTSIPLEKQIRGMIDIIVTYDKILGNRFHVYFERKRELLNTKLLEILGEQKRPAKNIFRRLRS